MTASTQPPLAANAQPVGPNRSLSGIATNNGAQDVQRGHTISFPPPRAALKEVIPCSQYMGHIR